MLRPAEPRGYSLSVSLQRRDGLLVVQTGYDTAEILLDALPHELLPTEELISHIVECASVSVVAVLGYREYLIVSFDGKIQLAADIITNER